MRSMTHRRGHRAGFTLLELIVVLAILVAIAGLAVTKLDVLQLKAEKASAALDMRNISRMIQTFRATTNFYPDRWDSLVVTGTRSLQVPGAPGSGQGGLDPGLVGTTGAGKLILSTDSLTANQARSLSRLGITTVYDHVGSTATPYSDGFTVENPIDGTDDVFATINPANAAGQRILNTIYPTPPSAANPAGNAVVPADRVLVVFGLGKWTTIVGSNLQSAVLTEPPIYPYSNELYYNRYLAVFEAYNNGGRCRLVAVLGADGDLAAEEIAEFNRD